MGQFAYTTTRGLWFGLTLATGGLALVGMSLVVSASRVDESESVPIPEQQVLPDVVGLETDDALGRLREVGIATSEIEFVWVPPAGRPVGTVATMEPSAGSSAETELVTLEVTRPVTRMPDVVGLTPELALSVLTSAGIPESDIRIERSSPAGTAAERVLWQHPEPYWEDPYGIVLGVAE